LLSEIHVINYLNVFIPFVTSHLNR